MHHKPFSVCEWLEYFYLNAVLQGSETAHRPHSHSDSLQMKQLKPRCTASACVTAHIVDSKWMHTHTRTHTLTHTHHIVNDIKC